MISRFAKCSAAGVLLLVSASPGLAAETIRNPGTFNFYYPNRDPLNGGVPTPASRMESDPAAMQAHARRERAASTIGSHRLASIVPHSGRRGRTSSHEQRLAPQTSLKRSIKAFGVSPRTG
jgi:hypothetical protein